MKCEEKQMLISSYIDDALDEASQGSMFTHLADCAGCREFLRRSLDVRAGLASLAQPEVPPSLDRTVLRMRPLRRGRVKSARERVQALWSHRLSVPLPSAALVALALIAVTLISISLWQNPEVVSVPCLPAVDVYAQPPAGEDKSN